MTDQEDCWLCGAEPAYHDPIGLGWCAMHYEESYLLASWRGTHDLSD